VSISGFHNGTVGHTINTIGKQEIIPSIPIDPPMISMTVTFNDSPIKGTEGDKNTMA
jgi:GTP-binding protein